MVICVYFFATLIETLFDFRPARPDTLAIFVSFVLLYLMGAITSFYVLAGARWARIVLSIVALLTVTASAMGLFAFFNAHPYSFVGIAFDIFALASAGVLLSVRKCAVS